MTAVLVGDLSRNFQCLINGKGATLNLFLKGFTFNELQDEKARALEFVKLVDGSDVGMVQRCQDFGFALESCNPLGIACERLAVGVLPYNRAGFFP